MACRNSPCYLRSARRAAGGQSGNNEVKRRDRRRANSLRGKWPGAESNCRHADFQSAALPTELPGRRTRNFISTNHFRKRERQWFVDAHRSQWDLQWDSLSAEVTLRNQRVLARFAAFLFHHFTELGRIGFLQRTLLQQCD